MYSICFKVKLKHERYLKGPKWTPKDENCNFSNIKKNTPNGNNSRLDIAEENISKLESRAIKTVHKVQRNKDKDDRRSLIGNCKWEGSGAKSLK